MQYKNHMKQLEIATIQEFAKWYKFWKYKLEKKDKLKKKLIQVPTRAKGPRRDVE